MFDFKAKLAKQVANNKSQETKKNTFYQENTKKLMAEGYTRSNARKIIQNFFNKVSAIGKQDSKKAEYAGINPRRLRRSNARTLGAPFRPQYNGPTFALVRGLNDEGAETETWQTL